MARDWGEDMCRQGALFKTRRGAVPATRGSGERVYVFWVIRPHCCTHNEPRLMGPAREPGEHCARVICVWGCQGAGNRGAR